jgi:PAS domain S-box-containing protein
MAHFLRTVKDLQPGDHLCCLYETEGEHRAVLTPFMRQGLERGEKVLYIVDAHSAEVVTGYLRENGLDIEHYLASGQLGILSADDVYMQGGVFDPDAMIALLRSETQRAIDEGYQALRATGEMSWALKGLPGSKRLVEYETKLNEFFPGSRCLAICQYDRRRFEPAVLLDVLATHPICVVGTELYDNFYYIRPAGLLGPDVSSKTLGHWLDNLDECKRAEEALTATWARLKYILDVLPVAIYTCEPAGVYRATFISENVRMIMGYEPQEFLDDPGFWADCIHPEDVARVFAELSSLFDKDHYSHEYRFRHKDGNYRWMQDVLRLIRDAEGSPQEIVGYWSDITGRKRSEEKLLEAKQRIEELARHEEQRADWLAIILDQLPAGVSIVSANGTVQLVNRAAEQLWGIEAGKLQSLADYGKGWRVLRPDGTPVPLEELAIRRALRGEPVTSLEEVLERRDSYKVPVVCSALPLWEGGQVAGAVVVFYDITAQKEAQRKLAEASQLKDEFLSMASHELRTPITAIKIFSELASRRPERITPEFLGMVLRQADRLAQLINDLLDVSRLELGRMPVEMRPLDLAALVGEMCERRRSLSEERQISRTIIPEEITVEGDPVRLEQVFSNLLDNAVKYSPEGSPIWLRVSRKHDKALVEVEDQGMGIAAEHLPHIFERFYKPGRHQAVYSGLGLGLYISKEIVEQHGGRIWAESKLGKGSTFFVELPLAQED